MPIRGEGEALGFAFAGEASWGLGEPAWAGRGVSAPARQAQERQVTGNVFSLPGSPALARSALSRQLRLLLLVVWDTWDGDFPAGAASCYKNSSRRMMV